ncbi:MAG: hypothetical protein ACRDR6_22790 [Pseudonocardiaceae bacterium]
MSQQHAMGTMADPHDLLRALKALAAIDRMPSVEEHVEMQASAGGEQLWRLECAHHLAGVAEAQALMAAGRAVDAGCDGSAVLLSGWQVYSGMGIEDDDAARVGVLAAIAARLVEYLMVMTARKRRRDGDELLSPLVMTVLPLASAARDLLKAAVAETSGEAEPRAGLPTITDNLRAMADLLDSMTPDLGRVGG